MSRRRRHGLFSFGIALIGVITLGGCSYYPHAALYWGGFEFGKIEMTRAAWVDPARRGKIGAFGEPHDPNSLTAAHPTLPYGTFVRVTNLDSGRAAILRINDRAAERKGRRLFVTERAAELLEMKEKGVANVRIEPIRAQVGIATWYGNVFHGRPTASGEIYNQYALTAAHRFLPFGTIVRVTNLANRRSVVVRINDRGGFIKGRILDLSRRAAKEIGIYKAGKGRVRVEIVAPPPPNGRSS